MKIWRVTDGEPIFKWDKDGKRMPCPFLSLPEHMSSPSSLHSGFRGTALAWLTLSSQAKTHNLLSSFFHSPPSHDSERSSKRVRNNTVCLRALILFSYTHCLRTNAVEWENEWVNMKPIIINILSCCVACGDSCGFAHQYSREKSEKPHGAEMKLRTVRLNSIIRLHLRWHLQYPCSHRVKTVLEDRP